MLFSYSFTSSGHFCGMAEMLTPVRVKMAWDFSLRHETDYCFNSCRLIIREAAQYGPLINGRVSSRFDGSLFGIYPMRRFDTSDSSM